MPVEPPAVTFREALVAFILALRDEHRADPEGWENDDLSRPGIPDQVFIGRSPAPAVAAIARSRSGVVQPEPRSAR